MYDVEKYANNMFGIQLNEDIPCVVMYWMVHVYLWVVEASIYTLAGAYLTNHFHTVPIRFVSCRCDAERYENSGEAGGEVLLYHLQSSST